VEISRKKFLLTDTVGFIDRLPLTLIEAFHSTLEETIYSDLILLMVDVSEPMLLIEKKLTICLETIERIGASGVPIITVMNKMDLLPERETRLKFEYLREKAPNPMLISALYKTNIDLLKQQILSMLRNYVQASISLPATKETMPFISWIFKTADVRTIKYVEDSANIVFEASPAFAEKVRKRVEEFNGKFEKIDIGS
jgi:GTP-binding protein HflX